MINNLRRPCINSSVTLCRLNDLVPERNTTKFTSNYAFNWENAEGFYVHKETTWQHVEHKTI